MPIVPTLTNTRPAHTPPWAGRDLSGVGIGLRTPHTDEILIQQPTIPWLEVLAENHLAGAGLVAMQLRAICEQYPITLHCVGMSLAGTTPLNMGYLGKIKWMQQEYRPVYISDHLSFCHQGDEYFHDLLPFPFSEESLQNTVQRVNQVQDFLGRQILVENSTRYIQFKESSLSEIDFIRGLLDETGCGLLLDINNIYVNSVNHRVDAAAFLQQVPWSQVKEIHLAGFEQQGECLLDTHNNLVDDAVWALYRQAREQTSAASLIEWDSQFPELSVLLEQAAMAERICTLAKHA